MILFEELDIGLGVGANGLGETDRDGVEIVEVYMRVTLELSADDWVVAPLDFDKSWRYTCSHLLW